MAREVQMEPWQKSAFEFIRDQMPEEFSLTELTEKNNIDPQTNFEVLKFLEHAGLLVCDECDDEILVEVNTEAMKEVAAVFFIGKKLRFRADGLTNSSIELLRTMLELAKDKNEFPMIELNRRVFPNSIRANSLQKLKVAGLIDIVQGENAFKTIVRLIDPERAKRIGESHDC
ncbi:MAG: hypothetical protein ABSD92_07210 [Candidatus Bathyarchaeia archaeon]|jgi:hypothetical protein